MTSLPLLAYLGGNSHSGTTLLHRVLSAHPDVVSLGSVRHLGAILRGSSDRRCSCRASTLRDCPRWSQVLMLADERTDGRLLDPQAVDPAQFSHDNRVLLEAVAEATGAAVVVDSSREVGRLRRLAKNRDLHVVPIHLIKDPRAQLASYRRKEMGGVEAVGRYVVTNLATRRATKSRDRVVVEYDHFCTEPDRVLMSLLERLGVDARASTVASILDRWGEVATHALGGNRMLKSTSSQIRRDTSWHNLATRRRALANLAQPVYWWCRR